MTEPTTPGTADTSTADATRAEVRALLRAAGLPASDTEVDQLAAAYPALRAGVDDLYRPPAVRYADPALRFRAEATLVDWV